MMSQRSVRLPMATRRGKGNPTGLVRSYRRENQEVDLSLIAIRRWDMAGCQLLSHDPPVSLPPHLSVSQVLVGSWCVSVEENPVQAESNCAEKIYQRGCWATKVKLHKPVPVFLLSKFVNIMVCHTSGLLVADVSLETLFPAEQTNEKVKKRYRKKKTKLEEAFPSYLQVTHGHTHTHTHIYCKSDCLTLSPGGLLWSRSSRREPASRHKAGLRDAEYWQIRRNDG